MRISPIVFILLMLSISLPLLAQEGSITQKLEVGATRLAQGEIKLAEPLMTRDGVQLQPGVYRIAVAVNTLSEGVFIVSPLKEENLAPAGLSKNALNTLRKMPDQVVIRNTVIRNSLVRGIAKIDGTFQIESLNPSEAVLSFTSKQFAASTIMGRSLDSKLMDLMPSQLTLEEPVSCGENCVEGYIKVTVKNSGNTMAKGKWNVMLLDPRFFIGSVTDLAPEEERTVVSGSKVKLPCCNPVSLDAEVHADFYNKAGSDSNDSNNARRFTLKLK
jgi:hypothetical protein